MHRIGAFLVVALLSLSTAAQAQYSLDTLSHRYVGPGMVHTHVVEPNRPWNINIFTADLTNPYLDVESAKANERLRGLERTSMMAARRDFEGHRIVGGVNGDFYAGGGEPINIQVVRGEVVKREVDGRTAIGFGPDNSPMMDFVSFAGEVIADGSTIQIDGVNEGRGADQLILFNSYIGGSTGANQFGTEAALQVIDPWVVNDTLRAVVTEMETGVGNMTLPENGVVLSGHGAASDAMLAAFTEGDTLRLLTRVQPAPGEIKEMVGGGPFIVVDGEVEIGPRGDGGVRHPRTAAGFSADSTKLILVTVDGRQSISVGMTLHELGTLMVQAGAATAMNLDGGGSTTMLVGGEVANSPSDAGGERSVSNSLLLFSTAPVGELETIRLSAQAVRLFRGTGYQVEVEGIDEFYNPLPLDSSLLSFDADPAIGTIDEHGLLQASMTADTGYVRVTYDNHRDSMRVIVKDIGRIDITPSSVLTDTLRNIEFSVLAYDTDNVERGVQTEEFEWSSTNESVGVVDSQGRFEGLAPGVTSVVATYRGLSDTASVIVETYGGYSLLDSLESDAGWTVSGQNADPGETPLVVVDTAATLGGQSFAVSYNFTSGTDPSRVFLSRTLDVPGVPDSIFVDVWSNESGHRVYFEAVDSKGDTYTFYPPGRRPNLPTDEFTTVAAPFDALQVLHPIQFARIGVQLAPSAGAGDVSSGSILFDNLRVSYPGHTETAIDAGEVPSDDVVLHPNFPNPFNSRTTLRYELSAPVHVTLEVFDLLGRVVRTLEDGPRAAGNHEIELEADGLPSGIYFVRLKAGSASKSRSVSIIR